MKRFSLSPETIWEMDEREISTLLESRVLDLQKKVIRFYVPSFMYYKTGYYSSSPTDFPTISITGRSCSLKCKHCGGVILDTMYSVKSSEELYELCVELRKNGAKGCLVSGGCLTDGSVPVGRVIDGIARVKRELGFTVIVHTGIIDEASAGALARVKVDSALIDVVGSNDTIREICKLDLTVSDYVRSLRALSESGISFVPHVVVGLHYGKLEGEMQALQMIRKYKPSALVIVAFMPIRGTEMESVRPSEPQQIAKVLTIARVMFPDTPVVLGCMRPRGRHRVETDTLAIKAGVDAIAFPTDEAVKFADGRNMAVRFSSVCCSQVYVDLLT